MEYQTMVTKEQKKELNEKFQKKRRILNVLLWFYVGTFFFFILMQFCDKCFATLTEVK